MANTTSRREFLKLAGAGLIAAPVIASVPGITRAQQSGSSRKAALHKKDVKRNDVILNVCDFGAKGDGVTKDTIALQQTIDRCWVLGGGEVIVPKGTYLTGGIALKTNTLLRLEAGAVLKGSPDFSDYPVMQVRWEGKWIQGHVGLIYAIDAEHTGIVGPGKIMGCHALGGRPTSENPLRHPALIEPIGCRYLRFEGFSTDYHQMWSLHPTNCDHVEIKDLIIRSTGGNGDGIDIDSCKHVRIDNCDIATGDDCISLKSGRGMEGYTLLQTTEDVTISNCTFADSIFACIGIGSETSGGIRDVVVRNCRFTYAKTHAIYIKSRPGRGAFIENIKVEDIEVSGTEGGFLRFNQLGSGIQDQYPVPGLDGIPTVKNFSFSRVKVHDVPVLVDGTSLHPLKPLQGFVLCDVTGTCRKGISLANVQHARLSNIHVSGCEGPLLSIANVTGQGLEGAVSIEPPKVQDIIQPSDPPYKLH